MLANTSPEAAQGTRPRQVRRLATEISALGWQEAGACRDADLALFFSPDAETAGVEDAVERRRRLRQAKRICGQCPVRLLCGRYALEHGEKFGVWGGLTETERRRMRSLGHQDSAAA
jgi:WhiB family redox-sensing transcriptional regulator